MSRLRDLASGLPDGATVLISRDDLIELLQEVGPGGETSREPQSDLTVAQVAQLFRRSPNSVRRWLETGDLKGYRLQGREWRIPAISLEEFKSAQPKSAHSSKGSAQADLGSWRRVRNSPRRNGGKP